MTGHGTDETDALVRLGCACDFRAPFCLGFNPASSCHRFPSRPPSNPLHPISMFVFGVESRQERAACCQPKCVRAAEVQSCLPPMRRMGRAPESRGGALGAQGRLGGPVVHGVCCASRQQRLLYSSGRGERHRVIEALLVNGCFLGTRGSRQSREPGARNGQDREGRLRLLVS